jgi:endo-1,4-beta-xylanase
MKMKQTQPERGRFTFADADAIVAFAARTKMRVRGHTLVWHQSLPPWVTTASWSRAEALTVLSQHITTVVSHFKGAVYAWDVVNEAFENDGSLRKTVWLDRIGPDYIEQAFRMAHAADPAALLFYNDYSVELPNKKADAMLALAKEFKARGVPIAGVGFQCHFPYDQYPDHTQFVANMNRFSSLGLQVQVTELDLAIPLPVTDEKRAQQARAYRDIVTAALKAKNCTALVTWGFTDKYSWIPHFRKGQDEALPFDRSFTPKPAYEAIRAALGK